MFKSLFSLLALIIAVSACESTDAVAGDGASDTGADEAGMICRNEYEVGSRKPSRRVCRPAPTTDAEE